MNNNILDSTPFFFNIIEYINPKAMPIGYNNILFLVSISKNIIFNFIIVIEHTYNKNLIQLCVKSSFDAELNFCIYINSIGISSILRKYHIDVFNKSSNVPSLLITKS